jgi:hypothetical protein
VIKDKIYKNISIFENSKSYFLFLSAIFMALIHLLSVLLSHNAGYHNTVLTEQIFYYSRFIAFFNISIPCISAMNYFITYNKNKNNPAFRWSYLKFLIKLFIVLSLVENSLEFLMVFPNVSLDIYSFAVLQFTGLSLILLHLILNYLGLIHLIFSGLFSLIVAPYVTVFFRSQDLYVLSGSNNYEYQWPLLPWFVIPVFGFLLSSIWVLKSEYKKFIFIVSSLVFLVLFYWTRTKINIQLDTRWGDAVYQPHTLIVVQNLIFIPILLHISEKLSVYRLIRRYDFVDVLSRGILFFYIIHIFLIEVLIDKNNDRSYIGLSLAERINIPFLLGIFLLLFLLIMFLSMKATKLCLKLFVDYKVTRTL